jgi:hypothetical protein
MFMRVCHWMPHALGEHVSAVCVCVHACACESSASTDPSTDVSSSQAAPASRSTAQLHGRTSLAPRLSSIPSLGAVEGRAGDRTKTLARDKRMEVVVAATRGPSPSALPHPTALATQCDRDADTVPPPVALSPHADGVQGWLPDLAAAARATSFQDLRRHLSGRSDAGRTVLPPDLHTLLDAYAVVHNDILVGRAPLRVWIVECHGQQHEEDCGGLGDRVKALRMFFYLCVLSGRALLMSDDWEGVLASEVFTPHRLPAFFLSAEVRQQLLERVRAEGGSAFDQLHFRRSEMLLHPDTMLAAAFTAGAFSNHSVVTVHTSKVPLMVLANETSRYVCHDDGGGSGVGSGATHAPAAWTTPTSLAPHLLSVTPHRAESTDATLHELVRTRMRSRLWDRDPNLPTPVSCVSPRAWDAVFGSQFPMPTSAMLDFLFAPNPTFLTHTLVPMLAALPAWNRPGPRIGVHLRTFELDKRR